MSKVEKCGKELGRWEKNVFGNVKLELNRLKKALVKEERLAMVSGNNYRVRQLKKEIEVLQDREATVGSMIKNTMGKPRGQKL